VKVQVNEERMKFCDLTIFFCAQWAPKKLTEEPKHNCVNTRSRLTEQYNKESDSCSTCISTGDETWIHYYKHKADAKYAMEAPIPSCHKKFKTQDIVGRSVLTEVLGR
jgi:hypothetical protein